MRPLSAVLGFLAFALLVGVCVYIFNRYTDTQDVPTQVYERETQVEREVAVPIEVEREVPVHVPSPPQVIERETIKHVPVPTPSHNTHSNNATTSEEPEAAPLGSE